MLPRLIAWLRPARLIGCLYCPPPARSPVARCRIPAIVGGAVAFVVAGGCGRTDPAVGKVVAVSGRVFVDGEQLRGKKGIVTFVPDYTKGNATTVQPSGQLDEDGTYTLYYAASKKGAPLGWYKVQVSAAQLGPGIKMGPSLKMDSKKTKGAAPQPAYLPFNQKFTNVKTSGLEVEVVDSPAAGAYDLKLTK